MDVAHDLGLHDDEIEPYGHTKAKVTLAGIERSRRRTPVASTWSSRRSARRRSARQEHNDRRARAGLNKIGRRAAVCIRQPSLGPVFGIKGGAAGGGYSQVIPMADFNLHLTGDVHAIGAAHKPRRRVPRQPPPPRQRARIDPFSVLWPRVVDISDRACGG